MKKIFISKKQAKLIKEAFNLSDFDKLPEPIRYSLNEKDLSNYPLDKVLCQKLLVNGYKDSMSCFSDDISRIPSKNMMNKLSKLISICKKKEDINKDNLVQLCNNTIIEMFNIPEGEIDITTDIVSNISDANDFHIQANIGDDYQYDDVDSMDRINLEVQKRRILDILVVGFAYKAFELARKYYMNDLFDIDEDLPHLYSKIMKIDRYLLNTQSISITDKSNKQGGYVNVVLGTDNNTTKIVAKGEVFPMTLFEAIRGIFELVISNGLPDNIDDAELVIDKADVLEEEPWDMRFGPEIVNIILDGSDIDDTKVYPSILKTFSDIDAYSLIKIFKEIAYNTKSSKRIINNILTKSLHDFEYSSFSDDIMKKQDEVNMIEDDYFTDEEL